jgi:hypothetical protein
VLKRGLKDKQKTKKPKKDLDKAGIVRDGRFSFDLPSSGAESVNPRR